MTAQQDWFANVVGITRLDLPNLGGWIEVRNELSIQEQRRVFGAAIKGETPMPDGQVRTDYDAERLLFGLVESYICDWSPRRLWFADVVGDTRVELPGLGWITLRDEISIGEEKRWSGGAIKGQTPTEDGRIRTEYDHSKVTFGRVIPYLKAWSARGPDGAPVELTAAAVGALKPHVYRSIESAVRTHREAMASRVTLEAIAASDVDTTAFDAAALRRLKPRVYGVLEEAVNRHAETMRAAVTEGNAPRASVSGDAPISPSAA